LDVIGDGEPFQSNIFNSLSLGNVVAVDLALRAFYSSSDILGIFDGSPEIPPGRIPMVYSDDAVVCRASLALTRGESSPGNGGSVGPMPLIPPYPIYNPWWWIETHGGTGPGPGPSPWARQLAAAMALAFAANKVAPKLQASVLEIALQQMSIATAALKKDLKVLRKK
jgi:hypothetical protein